MKNKINISIVLFLILGILYGCDDHNPTSFNAGDTNVGFDVNFSARFNETDGRVGIPLVLAGVPGGVKVNVTIAISSDVNGSAAIEGTDFTVENKTLEFNNGYGVDSIYINIIDNDVFEGNKTFKIEIASVSPELKQNVANSTIVTIVDDEHPLAAYFGTYAATDVNSDGTTDKYTVAISAVEGSTTDLSILNIWDGGRSVVAKIDTEEQTLVINPGQAVLVSGTYDIRMYYFNPSTSKFDTTTPIGAKIEENGTIVIDPWVAIQYGTSSAYGVLFGTVLEKL